MAKGQPYKECKIISSAERGGQINKGVQQVVQGLLLWTVDLEVPGLSPKWVPIFYLARPTAQGLRLPEPSSLQGSISVPEQLNIKAVTIIEWSEPCHRHKLLHTNPIWHDLMLLRAKSLSVIVIHYIARGVRI